MRIEVYLCGVEFFKFLQEAYCKVYEGVLTLEGYFVKDLDGVEILSYDVNKGVMAFIDKNAGILSPKDTVLAAYGSKEPGVIGNYVLSEELQYVNTHEGTCFISLMFILYEKINAYLKENYIYKVWETSFEYESILKRNGFSVEKIECYDGDYVLKYNKDDITFWVKGQYIFNQSSNAGRVIFWMLNHSEFKEVSSGVGVYRGFTDLYGLVTSLEKE